MTSQHGHTIRKSTDPTYIGELIGVLGAMVDGVERPDSGLLRAATKMAKGLLAEHEGRVAEARLPVTPLSNEQSNT